MWNLLRSRLVARALCAWVIAVNGFGLAAAHSARASSTPPAGSPVSLLAAPVSPMAAQVPAAGAVVPAVIDVTVTTIVTATTATTATTDPSPSPTPPPSAPAPVAPLAPTLTREQRVAAAYRGSVPAAWRAAIPVRLVIVAGHTSWADPRGEIQVAMGHADGDVEHLRAVLAHEFGHMVAFWYGAQVPNGAAPDGWPAYGSHPEEAWADCVSQVATGVLAPTAGQPPCGGSALSWTREWMAAGPSAHPRTYG